MDPTISVSKGCFVFKNGATRAAKAAKKSAKRRKVAGNTVLGKDFTDQPFYRTYAETWRRLEKEIEELQRGSYTRTLDSLVDILAAPEDALDADDQILPAAALLTGINQPDHLEQFEALAQRIHERISASVCVLQSRDCGTLKAAVEAMVYNLIETLRNHDDEEGEEENDRDRKRLRRSQCTMKHLKHWYQNNFSAAPDGDSEADEQRKRHVLVVILPDFECFSARVLQDFVLILSAHRAQMPFVLVLGVATSISAVHNSLPYHVMSKLKLCVFHTKPAPVGLNEILDRVILSPRNAFHLSGKAFKFLTHIFLYYDFSINGFIQGFKYCLMEHFFQGNAYALCGSYAKSLSQIKELTHDDAETIRRLLSFRPYVERMNNCKRVIAILTDDDYLKKKLPQLLKDCHIHFLLFRVFLEFLVSLVEDLPKCPLGKYRRELYALCLARDIVNEEQYKECWKILGFMSKEEFVEKISKAINTTQEFFNTELNESLELSFECAAIVNETLTVAREMLTNVSEAGINQKQLSPKLTATEINFKKVTSRHDLKEHLLQMSKEKPISAYSSAVQKMLTFIQAKIIERFIKPLSSAPPLYELFVFEDIATVRRHIIGAPRAALHMALQNPHFYMQCKCCYLSDPNHLLATLPDLSVVYKLHLECGRMINIFDWLQAFRSVVDAGEADNDQVNPQIQARFTRAVAELQFLGYIKMSKRKTDHATRLTW